MSDDEAMDRVLDVYRPVWYVEYEVPKVIPGLGVHHQQEYLGALYNKHQDFMSELASNDELLQRLKSGLQSDSSKMEAGNKLDEAIEAALLNRSEFATCQLNRAIETEPYVEVSPDEKKRVVREVFQEFCESNELLKAWGSKKTLDAHEENQDSFGEALMLGELVGVDLVGELDSSKAPTREPSSALPVVGKSPKNSEE